MFLRLKKAVITMVAVCSLGVASTPARAGIPVIDVANLAQAIQEVIAWGQQYGQMVQQYEKLVQTYTQLQQSYAAITGGRGMEALAPMTTIARNYLPSDYTELANVMNNTSTTYSGLATQVQGIITSKSILSTVQVSSLSPQAQQLVDSGRKSGALLQTIATNAQQSQSNRFATLDSLRAQIGAASDDKAIQDLQGRIATEQLMITVEGNKNQAIYQQVYAQELQRQQVEREAAVKQLGRQANLAALSW